ncbi:hypothetical protein M422DRAFT_68486, partial [Sphaerobolus stellatus SS14]
MDDIFPQIVFPWKTLKQFELDTAATRHDILFIVNDYMAQQNPLKQPLKELSLKVSRFASEDVDSFLNAFNSTKLPLLHLGHCEPIEDEDLTSIIQKFPGLTELVLLQLTIYNDDGDDGDNMDMDIDDDDDDRLFQDWEIPGDILMARLRNLKALKYLR